MLIAIHSSKISYSERWIEYCEEKNIPFKVVDCYRSDIIKQLEGCDALMWHYFQGNPKDMLFARQLLAAVESSGKLVYPNYKSGWHFDDKVGQKYLLEANNLPLVPSYVFYTRNDAVDWLKNAEIPLVMKLRNGAAGNNVRLVKTRQSAMSLINKAFNRGFRPVDPFTDFSDKLRKFRKSKVEFSEVLRALSHIVYPYQLEKGRGREKGYIYLQKFIPDCTFDIRVQIVYGNAWAMLRKVRKGDFRASGSGDLIYNKELIPANVLDLSFEIFNRLGMQSIAIDFLLHKDQPLITEICYAFGIDAEELEEGYWDKDKVWHSGRFNPYGWMVDGLIEKMGN